MCAESVFSPIGKEDGFVSEGQKSSAAILGRNIGGRLRAGRDWQMAVDLDKQLGRVHLDQMHLVLQPPVADFVLTWLPKIRLRIKHEGDFTS